MKNCYKIKLKKFYLQIWPLTVLNLTSHNFYSFLLIFLPQISFSNEISSK
jgi:hypothetical protein